MGIITICPESRVGMSPPPHLCHCVVVAVDPDGARLHPLAEGEGGLQVPGQDARGQAVARAVGPQDGLADRLSVVSTFGQPRTKHSQGPSTWRLNPGMTLSCHDA